MVSPAVLALADRRRMDWGYWAIYSQANTITVKNARGAVVYSMINHPTVIMRWGAH